MEIACLPFYLNHLHFLIKPCLILYLTLLVSNTRWSLMVKLNLNLNLFPDMKYLEA